MRAAIFILLIAGCSGLAGDIINFTNKTVTITNLEGRVFRDVDLARADLDGLIWRQQASGGRICYTNLDPMLLASLGISSNRIDIARSRAEKKAITDARYRAMVAAEAQANTLARDQALSDAYDHPPKKAADSMSAQQKQDAAVIQEMQARYDALEREKRHNLAVVQNGWQNGQDGYINYVAIEQLEDFRQNLEKAKRQYIQKYGSLPPE
jgi:hypothetical protein